MSGVPRQREIIIAPHLLQPRYAPYREVTIGESEDPPLVAYRVWQIRGTSVWPDGNLTYELRGIHPLCPAAWTDRRHEGYCLSKPIHGRANRAHEYVPHDAAPPVATCTCGVSAYYEPISDTGDGWPIVAGVVSLSGRAIMHDVWLRAQSAQVEALGMNAAVNAEHRSAVEAAAHAWAVPLIELEELGAFGRQHGREVPCELRAR
jgi:hypothetical protein